MTSYAPLKEQLNNWNLSHDNQKLEESKFEDNPIKPKQSKKEEQNQPEPDQRFKQAIEIALNTCNLEQYTDLTDANDENLSSTGSSDDRLSQFSSITALKGNNFPAIIGSQTFMKDQFIGIKIEDMPLPQIQFEPVATNQNIVPGNIQMVQSNIPQPPQLNISQNQQSTIPQPPSLNISANLQSTIPQPPQLNVQANIPQPPPLISIQKAPNIPQPPQIQSKPPALPQQSNIVQSGNAPPPPPLNLIPKPPVLPSLPKPKAPQQQQQIQQQAPKPAPKQEISIQEAFQQKLKEMQAKKNQNN